jgi:hypothetical protein
MLVTMTAQGEQAYAVASERQAVWAEALAAALPSQDLATAAAVLRELQRRLAGPVAAPEEPEA